MSYKHPKSSLCKNQPEQNEEHEIKEFHWSDKKSKSLEAAVAAGSQIPWIVATKNPSHSISKSSR
jgi:hypothetical protein